jgi:hypothetical protein
MSLDFRLMMLYHGCMMALFLFGGNLSVYRELQIAGIVLVALLVISLRYRRQQNWRWPAIRRLDILRAAGGGVLTAVFLFAATPLFPPSDSRALPWYLAGLGIGVFNILCLLNLVCLSKADFLAQCSSSDQPGRELVAPPPQPAATVIEARWKNVVRRSYTVAFFAVWLSFLAFFYLFGVSFKNGSPVATVSQSEALQDHGKTAYITREEKRRIDTLQLVSMIGMPSVILGGLLLHFVVGIKLIDPRTLADFRAKKSYKLYRR